MKARAKTSIILSLMLLTTAANMRADDEIINDGIVYTVSDETTNPVSVVISGFSLADEQTKVSFCKTFTKDDVDYNVIGIKYPELLEKLNGTNVTELEFNRAWTVDELASWLFYYATKIEKFSVTGDSTAVGVRAQADALYANNMKTLICYPIARNKASFTVPTGVETITSSAFRGNRYLTTITLSASLKSIRMEAFAQMPNLQTVEARESSNYFKTIDNVLFQVAAPDVDEDEFGKTLVCYPAGRSGTTYEVAKDVEIIGRSAFEGATLTSITFESESDLNEIEEYAFNHCYYLTTLKIPASVETINSLYDDEGNETKGAGSGAFNHCRSLKIEVEEGNEYFTVVDDVLFTKDMTRLIRYGCTKAYPGYIVPATVTKIDAYAFDCASYNCGAGNKLRHVVLPSGLTRIRKNTFQGCGELQSITIPAKVTNVAANAFKDNDTHLTEVFMMPVTPPTLGSNAFTAYDAQHIKLYVKPSCVNTYKDASGWSAFECISKDIPVKLNAYGYTTICRDFDVFLGYRDKNDLCAYIPTAVTSDDNDDRSYLEMTVDRYDGRYLPSRFGTNNGKYQGFVLKKVNDKASYTYEIGELDYNTTGQIEPGSDNLAKSMMVGVPVETNVTVYESNYTNFGFKGTLFQRLASNGMLPYNKAYLHLPNGVVPGYVPGNSVASGAKMNLVFIDDFDETITGIDQVTTSNDDSRTNDGRWYTLQGAVVGTGEDIAGSIPKGIYIHNGRKVIVK